MGFEVKRNTLKSFLTKIGTDEKEIKNIGARLVAMTGVGYANEEYNTDPEHQRAEVSYTVEDNGKAQIFARGVGLFYLEYGTGTEGEQSHYPADKLEFPIDFISPYKDENDERVPVHLDRWTYYYAYQLGLNKNEKFKGHEAYAQMFNTSQRLREKFAKYIKE